MTELATGQSPYDLDLTTADGLRIGLMLAPRVDSKGVPLPHEADGALAPQDATTTFRPGGVPKVWADFSGGSGYSFEDPEAPNTFAWSKNVWTMIKGTAFPGPELTEVTLPAPAMSGEIAAGIELQSHLYVSAGQVALDVFSGTTVQVCNFVSLTGNSSYRATSVTEYLGKAYFGAYNYAQATAAQMVEMTVSAGTATFSASSDTFRWQLGSFFGYDGNGDWDQWMIGTMGTNAAFKITNSSLPMTESNWTPGSATGTAFGNYDFQVNRIVIGQGQPFLLTRAGVYVVQRAGVYTPSITPGWLDQYATTNGVAGIVVGNRLYASFSGAIDSVGILDGPNVPNLVGPGIDTPNKTPVRGICYAMCQDGEWLVAAFYDSYQQISYICWGKPGGPSGWTWHAAPVVIEGERVTWLHKSAPAGVPRLWIATRDAAESMTHLYWIPLPSSGNILQDLAVAGPWRCRVDTCTLYLSATRWTQGIHAEKALRNVATVTQGAGNLSYLNVYAAADTNAREQLGPTVINSPYVEGRILTDVSGREISPSIDFKAGDQTAPPILRELTIWAAEGVRATQTIDITVRISKGMKLRTPNRGADTRDPEVVWNQLLTAQGPRPASLTNWRGVTATVAYEQGCAWKEREVKTAKRWEIDVRLRFTVLAQEARYGDGSQFGSTLLAGAS